MNSNPDSEIDLLTLLKAVPVPVVRPELRVYYDADGKIITYTCENLPGEYIVVTPQQFAEARPDALVKNGKLVYTHRLSHITKLSSAQSGIKTSHWDINIIVEPEQEGCFWDITVNEVQSPE